MKKRWLPFLLCLLLAAGLILVGLFLSKKNRASGVEVFLPSAQSPSANDVTEDGSLSQSVSDNDSLKVSSVIKTDGLGYQVNDKKKDYWKNGSYAPKNSDGKYNGIMSLQDALGVSKNTTAAQAMIDLVTAKGYDYWIDYCKKLGFSDEVAEGFNEQYARIVISTVFLIDFFTSNFMYKILRCKHSYESDEFKEYYNENKE